MATTHLGGGVYTSPEIEERRAKKEAEWEESQRRLRVEESQRPRGKTLDEIKALHKTPVERVAETGCIGDLSAHGK